VSEVMLQQTQVERVAPFYKKFMREFPTPTALTRAPLKKVLRVWSGLGYNRRALYLQRAAQKMVREHDGQVPRSIAELDALPGIGEATAAAICAYAYNAPVVFVETNIRTVFLHHFFPKRNKVRDREILEVVKHTLPKSKIREWYAGLMDYGTHLKEKHGNQNVRSAHYTKQKPFVGSVRHMRGELLRRALAGTLWAADFPPPIVAQMKKEGFLAL